MNTKHPHYIAYLLGSLVFAVAAVFMWQFYPAGAGMSAALSITCAGACYVVCKYGDVSISYFIPKKWVTRSGYFPLFLLVNATILMEESMFADSFVFAFISSLLLNAAVGFGMAAIDQRDTPDRI